MIMMGRCAGLLCLFVLANSARAEIRVFFDKDEYVVSTVGESFDIRVLIDADDSTGQLDPVRGGLFSFGTEVTFDANKAQVSGPAAVNVTSPLDYFGFASGAFIEVAAGQAAGKGNIDQFANPLVPYEGSLLATITVTNMASAVDQYPLNLDFFRTLGDNEQLFLNGAGDVLDGDIVFGDAIVRVIPEPATAYLFAAGLLLLTLSRRSSVERQELMEL